MRLPRDKFLVEMHKRFRFSDLFVAYALCLTNDAARALLLCRCTFLFSQHQFGKHNRYRCKMTLFNEFTTKPYTVEVTKFDWTVKSALKICQFSQMYRKVQCDQNGWCGGIFTIFFSKNKLDWMLANDFIVRSIFTCNFIPFIASVDS